MSLNFRWPVVLIVFAWLLPIILHVILPFTMGFDADFLFVFFVVLFLFASVFLPIFVVPKRRHYEYECLSRSKLSRWFVILAYVSLVIQGVDIFYLRGINLGFDFGSNRDYFSDGSSLATVSIMFLPFVYISLNGFFESKKLIYVLPFIFTSLFFVVSGNRQFFIFGVILFLVLYLMVNPRLNFKFIFKLILFASVLVSLLFFVQFKRQGFAEGQQLEFVYNITGMECNGAACDKFYITPMAYLYLYFGVQYQGLTAVVDLSADYSEYRAPLFSQTVPVVYRRLESIFALKPQMEVHMDMYEIFEREYNVFPRFWRTMFSDFISEYGILGIGLLLLLLFMFGLYYLVVFVSSLSTLSFFTLATFYSSVIFGVMFFPLFEPVIFFLFIYLFVISVFQLLGFRL